MSSLTQEDRENIKEIVCEILEIDSGELSETSRFKEEHDADSLRAIEILAALEKEFDVTIEQSELAGMVNLEGVYSVVSKASEK
ncbi:MULTISPECIES: acyl carrier protein [unclassified Streptomyces]|uniref:acyl carrier protein n=1 Tax=unclassified Streptomyces TaxID=2593676 RepID=UPI002DDA9ED2|nr:MULTISPECIES: acyl carrier protein [unclassified Streptomyces]WSA90510.1 acyl carrier protein [Streptomyces sp. NBC_01795]WSB74835.1 acyl carrier protein [Streptomyces sp. NBC_01775]WSS16882.1 acyl carrier protein [Streptomyces sp. NBC_01186]WSS45625.1 acyl carrier protein [Streptomyces sp. NBC_01187]